MVYVISTAPFCLLTSDGQPTSEAVSRYTEGDCWLLAFQVGILLDAPLVALVPPCNTDDWAHIAVDLGRETVLDVQGRATRDELAHRWSTRPSRTLTFRELGRHTDLELYVTLLDARYLLQYVSERDESDARRVASSLVRRH